MPPAAPPAARAARLLASALVLVSCGSPALALLQLRSGGRALDATGTAVCKGSTAARPWTYQDAGQSWDIGECCLGTGQSPLNLSAVAALNGGEAAGDKIFFGFVPVQSPFEVVNDGHALVAEVGPRAGGFALGSAFPDLLSSRWRVWKVVVHTPSEHTFQGVRVPLELQVVHRRKGVSLEDPAAADLAIVSVGFVAGGRPSPLLNVLRGRGLPLDKNGRTTVNTAGSQTLDFSELFGKGIMGSEGTPRSQMFWDYEGSFTSPPCTRGVRWFVRHDPLPASMETLSAFKEAVTAVTPVNQVQVGNARKLQSPCGRTMSLRQTKDVSALMEFDSAIKDDGFEAAVARAAARQRDFEASMVPEAAAYHECLQRLAMAVRDLESARKQQALHCGKIEEARGQLKTADPGLARIRVVTALKSSAAQCGAIGKVVAGLSQELSGGKSRCTALKK